MLFGQTPTHELTVNIYFVPSAIKSHVRTLSLVLHTDLFVCMDVADRHLAHISVYQGHVIKVF